MQIQHILNNTLLSIRTFIVHLSDVQFSQKIDLLEASIGEHTRHCLEMIAELYHNYDGANICYDNRKRDLRLQSNVSAAVQHIDTLIQYPLFQNKALTLLQKFDEQQLCFQSDVEREIAFHVEHCIHHQALIKIAAKLLQISFGDANFGISHATVAYRNQSENTTACATQREG
jgi:hypothetical protein